MLTRILSATALCSMVFAGSASASTVILQDFEGATLGSTNGNSVVVDDGTGNQLLEADLSDGGFLGQLSIGTSTFTNLGVDPLEIVAFEVDVSYEAGPFNLSDVGFVLRFQNFLGGTENLTPLPTQSATAGGGITTLRYDLTPTTQAGFLAGNPNFQNIQFVTDPGFGLDGTFTIDNLSVVVPEPASLALVGLGLPALLARRRK